MAKRKQYVYVVNATKHVCGNLQSAIEIAMDDMYKAERMFMDRAQLSAPIVTKTWGGYQVVAVGYDGRVRKRRIDVFEPYRQPQGCKQYKVDRAYAMHYAAHVTDIVDEIEDHNPDEDKDEDEKPAAYCDNCGKAIYDEDEIVDGEEGEYCCDECREEAEDEEETEDSAEVAEV